MKLFNGEINIVVSFSTMQNLLKAFGNTNGNVCKIRSIERALKRTYKSKVERSNLIKVAVVGSGSFGDPAALVVRTCDNFMYVDLKTFIE